MHTPVPPQTPASARPSQADLGSLGSTASQAAIQLLLSVMETAAAAVGHGHLQPFVSTPSQPAFFEHFCPMALETGLLQGWTGIENAV